VWDGETLVEGEGAVIKREDGVCRLEGATVEVCPRPFLTAALTRAPEAYPLCKFLCDSGVRWRLPSLAVKHACFT
jgi:hypothetical protein